MSVLTSPQQLAVGEGSKSQNTKDLSKKSYIESILTNQNTLSNFELYPVVRDKGEPVIQFSKDDVDNFITEEGLHQAAILKFSYGRPDLAEVRRSFSSQFDIQGHFIIGQLEYRHLLIRFDLFNDYVHVLSKLSGYFKSKGDDFFFRTFPWTLEFNPKEETSKAVVWISLPGLPPNFFAKRSLLSIASAVGKPLAIDKATQDRTRPSVARVKIIIDLLAYLPNKIKLQIVDSVGKTVDFYQDIIFDNLPKYCVFCKHQGHEEKECKFKIAKLDVAQRNRSKDSDLPGLHSVEIEKMQGDARVFLNSRKLSQASKVLQEKDVNPRIVSKKKPQQWIQKDPQANVEKHSVLVNSLAKFDVNTPISQNVQTVQTRGNDIGVVEAANSSKETMDLECQDAKKEIQVTLVNINETSMSSKKALVNANTSVGDNELAVSPSACVIKDANQKEFPSFQGNQSADNSSGKGNYTYKKLHQNLSELASIDKDFPEKDSKQKEMQTDTVYEDCTHNHDTLPISDNAIKDQSPTQFNRSVTDTLNDIVSEKGMNPDIQLDNDSYSQQVEHMISDQHLKCKQNDISCRNVELLVQNSFSVLEADDNDLPAKECKQVEMQIVAEDEDCIKPQETVPSSEKDSKVVQQNKVYDPKVHDAVKESYTSVDAASSTCSSSVKDATEKWKNPMTSILLKPISKIEFDLSIANNSFINGSISGIKNDQEQQFLSDKLIGHFLRCKATVPSKMAFANNTKYLGSVSGESIDSIAIQNATGSITNPAVITYDIWASQSSLFGDNDSKMTAKDIKCEMIQKQMQVMEEGFSTVCEQIGTSKSTSALLLEKMEIENKIGGVIKKVISFTPLSISNAYSGEDIIGNEDISSFEETSKQAIISSMKESVIKSKLWDQRPFSDEVNWDEDSSGGSSTEEENQLEDISSGEESDNTIKPFFQPSHAKRNEITNPADSASGLNHNAPIFIPNKPATAYQMMEPKIGVTQKEQEQNAIIPYTDNSGNGYGSESFGLLTPSEQCPFQTEMEGRHIYEEGEEEDILTQCRINAARRGDLSPKYSNPNKKNHRRERSWDDRLVDHAAIRKLPMRMAKLKQVTHPSVTKPRKSKNKAS